MSHEHSTILAISIKSTRIGAAVLEGEKLLYYQIINLISSRSELRNMTRGLDHLILLHRPNILVAEQFIYPQQKTAKSKALFERIQKIAADHRLKFRIYSPVDVIHELLPAVRPTRQRSAHHIANVYPELKKYLIKQSKWQLLYINPLFSAASLGLYAARQIMNQ